MIAKWSNLVLGASLAVSVFENQLINHNISDDENYDDAANNNNFGEASGDNANSAGSTGKEVRYAPQHSNSICNQAPLQRAHSR